MADNLAYYEARCAKLERGLRKAIDKFRYYEGVHRAKRTLDGDQKAEVNHQLAKELEELLNV